MLPHHAAPSSLYIPSTDIPKGSSVQSVCSSAHPLMWGRNAPAQTWRENVRPAARAPEAVTERSLECDASPLDEREDALRAEAAAPLMVVALQ